MKIMSKNKLAMCVGALVGSVGLIPAANAVNLATDGLGDALVNYYTTNNGRSTLINYTNTSNQQIALRVRLHESSNSRPVDFTVILSPYDVWNATISDGGADVGPVISTSDESCTIPRITKNALKDAFINAGVTDIDAMREGYVAAIVMGSTPGTHPTPVNCTAETNLFLDRKVGGFAALMAKYGNYTNNAIKGVYNILNLPLGQNAASGMTTLANFFSPSSPSAPNVSGVQPVYDPAALNGANLKSLVTLQLDPDVIEPLSAMTPEARYLASFYLPTLASANTPASLLLGTNLVGTTAAPLPLANQVGAQAVSYLFQKTNVINMWTAYEGSAWDTATDLVVQSFTKQFYVDTDSAVISGRNPMKPGVPPTNVLLNGVATAPFASPFVAGESCDRVSWTIWDRAEHMDETPDSGRFSPTPAEIDSLCFETNVISFNESYALGSNNTYNINSTFDNGWIDLDLRGVGNRYGTGQTSYFRPNDLPAYYGLPVDSFAFTTRTADSGLNEAIIVPSASRSNPAFVTVHVVP